MSQNTISEYATPGRGPVPVAPISMGEFQELKETAMFTNEDVQYLRMSWEVLRDQVDSVLDVWYNFFGSHAFLAHTFSLPFNQQQSTGIQKEVGERHTILTFGLLTRSI